MLLRPQSLKKPPPHDFTYLSLVIRDQILRHAPNDLGDLVLPLQIPVRHLDLASRQADDSRAVRGARHGDRQVLEKRIEPIGQIPMPIAEVEHLVAENQDPATGGFEEPAQCFGSWRSLLGGGTQCRNSGGAGELVGEVQPWRLPPGFRVPCVSYESANLRRRTFRLSQTV